MIKWRDYEPRDEAAVKALHAEMEAKIGRKLDLPDLDKQPVLVCQVGETNGVVTHGVFAEAEVEVCAIGINPLSAKEMKPAIKRLTEVAQGYNLHIARCYVPVQLLEPNKRGRKSAISRMLGKIGFTEETGELKQFFKWLVPPKVDKENR